MASTLRIPRGGDPATIPRPASDTMSARFKNSKTPEMGGPSSPARQWVSERWRRLASPPSPRPTRPAFDRRRWQGPPSRPKSGRTAPGIVPARKGGSFYQLPGPTFREPAQGNRRRMRGKRRTHVGRFAGIHSAFGKQHPGIADCQPSFRCASIAGVNGQSGIVLAHSYPMSYLRQGHGRRSRSESRLGRARGPWFSPIPSAPPTPLEGPAKARHPRSCIFQNPPRSSWRLSKSNPFVFPVFGGGRDRTRP